MLGTGTLFSVSVEVGLWRLRDGRALAVAEGIMPSEQMLEDVLEQDISILDSDLFVIGRQFLTPNGKRLDLLAIAGDGSLTVIELKRGRTEREVVIQALDYGSYVQTLTRDKLLAMYASKNPGREARGRVHCLFRYRTARGVRRTQAADRRRQHGR